jgi:ATP-binding protein involved in chromosome partitioning
MARKGYLRVAGVVENMSGFSCAHGEHYDLFGSGGGQRLAQEVGAPLLACIPLEPAVSAGGDRGEPASGVFEGLVDAVLKVAPIVEMRDCTARLIDAMAASLEQT